MGHDVLVTKLCFVTHLWSETPFCMAGVSAGAELTVLQHTTCLTRRHPAPPETPFGRLTISESFGQKRVTKQEFRHEGRVLS